MLEKVEIDIMEAVSASAWNQVLAKQVLARSTDTQVLASCFLGAWRATGKYLQPPVLTSTCKYLGLTLLDYVRCTMFKRGYSGNNVEHPAACCNK